jgi:hypothetical protein
LCVDEHAQVLSRGELQALLLILPRRATNTRVKQHNVATRCSYAPIDALAAAGRAESRPDS